MLHLPKNNPPNRHRRYFQIGHVAISMIARNTELLELAGDWMANFEVNLSQEVQVPYSRSEIGSNQETTEQSIIRFTMIAYESNERVPFMLPTTSKLLYQNDYTAYYEYQGLWIILLQAATVIINRTTNKILALTHYNDLKRTKYIEDFMHPLVELLRQNGLYAHHAAAVSLEGRGLLLLGKSGQGKTTLSVDLLSHGFDFLADDRCFMRENAQGLEVISFYEPIRYFSINMEHIKIIEQFGETQGLPLLANGKKQVDLLPIYQDKIIDSSKLVGLVQGYVKVEQNLSVARYIK